MDVDVPPELLLARTGEGAAAPERARRFSELREIALLLAADIVEQQLEEHLAVRVESTNPGGPRSAYERQGRRGRRRHQHTATTHTLNRHLGFLGEPRANVLELNLALDRDLP